MNIKKTVELNFDEVVAARRYRVHGPALRAARRKASPKLDVFLKEMGWSRQYLSRLETSFSVTLDARVIRKLCAALKIKCPCEDIAY